jgi:hypothetical protein
MSGGPNECPGWTVACGQTGLVGARPPPLAAARRLSPPLAASRRLATVRPPRYGPAASLRSGRLAATRPRLAGRSSTGSAGWTCWSTTRAPVAGRHSARRRRRRTHRATPRLFRAWLRFALMPGPVRVGSCWGRSCCEPILFRSVLHLRPALLRPRCCGWAVAIRSGYGLVLLRRGWAAARFGYRPILLQRGLAAARSCCSVVGLRSRLVAARVVAVRSGCRPVLQRSGVAAARPLATWSSG